ncbi:MAG TPA: hypothetical protein DFK15_17955 [Butyricimonas sp.]|nr:hypothetical protein [Butyricimonas sp.]HCH91159.1 hypothetical protein [Butyricimonas sp.]
MESITQNHSKILAMYYQNRGKIWTRVKKIILVLVFFYNWDSNIENCKLFIIQVLIIIESLLIAKMNV